jgi:hypothetical protein
MYPGLVVGVAGVVIWAVCARLEAGSDAEDVFFAERHRTKEKMTRAERAAHRHERSSADRAARFFKTVGIGLAAIGFGGAAVIHLLGA